MNPRRSASVGALPFEKKHYVSRNESTSGVSLDVRCACQYFQCDSLLPDRVNPVDSRPSSNLGHYADLTAVNFSEEQEHAFDMAMQRGMQQPMQLTAAAAAAVQLDELSNRSYNITGPIHRDLDHISTHSIEPNPTAVDLSFVEKYPELEQTAKTRGLVVQSISTASNMDSIGQQRRRSLSRMSTGSGHFGHGHALPYGRDIDTVSVRSGTSLRRISRSPSKADLYVADINIPIGGAAVMSSAAQREERRSMSASRNASNSDLTLTLPPTASRHIVSAQLHVATIAPPVAPQVNLIAPTPSPAVGLASPDFERGRTLQRTSSTSRSRAVTRNLSPDRMESPSFVRATTPQITASPPPPPEDYRKAKPPTTADYMRPEENKLNFRDYHQPGELLPQNRPIDVSKYDSYGESILTKPIERMQPYDATLTPATFAGTMPRPAAPQRSMPIQRATTLPHMPSNIPTAQLTSSYSVSIDPLQQMVAQLEAQAATSNIENIRDNIKMETTRDPSLAGEIHLPPLHLDEETQIEIKSAVPVVDIDALIQEEEFKARQNQQKPRSRPQSPQMERQKMQKMDTLQLPEQSRTRRVATTDSSVLKRQHSPERSIMTKQRSRSPSPNMQMQRPLLSNIQQQRSPSPSTQRERSPSPSVHHDSAIPLNTQISKSSLPSAQRLEPQAIVMHTIPASGSIPLTEASPEAKTSYASRFKSMFSSKNNEQQMDSKPSLKRQKSLSPKPRQSVSPSREKSPSPMPTKLLSVFSRSKPMTIKSGTSAVVTTKSENEPLAVRITETFSLKVDDMDQYTSRPARPPQPPATSTSARTSPARTVQSSRENFGDFERISNDLPITEAFTPVIIPTANRAQFMAGNRTFYSSEIDLQSQRSVSVTRSTSREQLGARLGRFQVPKGALISMPIHIGDSGHISQGASPAIGNSEQSLQQKVTYSSIVHKTPFDAGRTQSQDRARSTAAFDDMFGKSMTKTVSFNFGERQSRLGEFESGTMSQKQKDQKTYLEKTYFSRDHEYEPIGQPTEDVRASSITKEPSPARPMDQTEQAIDFALLHAEMKESLNQDFAEDRYFSSEATTPRTESRTDYEIHTSQVDSSALEELPLKPENRKKSFMASAQDRTRKMQAGFKSQAGKIKTKFRTPATKKSSTPPPPEAPLATGELSPESPKAEKRKRFKAPEFPKMKMPEIKRPDMSKFKEMKRPEFTKFSRPDMSKFKLPDKFSTLKIRRSKSFKENETPLDDEDDMSAVTPESAVAVKKTEQHPPPHKKIFDFKFGTYPRAFRRKGKPVEPESLANTETGTEDPSTVPSTVTQPSLESSSSPQGDRGPGPVRSRWADKFSDVSYNDSEGSRYRRYGSEQESFDRESSLERQMKEELELEETASEAQEMGILGAASEFPEFDEENRAIHEISSQRAGEFKRRRPMVHQDSDLRSEDSKDAVGWTDKEIQKNKLLQKAEYEAELTFIKYNLEDPGLQDTRSTASSGKKVVMEEIDDDEFFLRKRGISEDNIQLRQMISEAIREGYDVPRNALDAVGRSSDEFGYDAPPPKPRRLHKHYRPEDVSQEFDTQRSDYGDDLSVSQNESDFFGAPKRPLRKGRSRSKYSAESQEPPQSFENISRQRYFDDDEEYLRPPKGAYLDDEEDDVKMNNLDINVKEEEQMDVDEVPQPQVPRRRKRQSSIEKDVFINGFGGRSVSNTYLQPREDVIVYRTEHEYPIPRATPEINTDASISHVGKSLSASRFDEDDRTSRGADSLALDGNLKQEYDVDSQDKFIIDMMENDGYAVVRKEHIPKPTPPARRKKFTRSPGERFATLPNIRLRSSRNTPPPERPPPPRSYTPSTDFISPPSRKSAQSLEAPPNSHHRHHMDDDDYEELSALDYGRAESPRDLQSGEVVSRMKDRPLPAPPRPTRVKRQRGGSRESQHDSHAEENLDDRDFIATSSTVESELESEPQVPEVEVSTQTDPLPDDFICEEFEITSDMKVIQARPMSKTLEDLLAEAERKIREQEAEEEQQLTEDEQLARGLQRFREANQRSVSERSRASSQADRSRSLSRPQTPSAVVIERRVSTPVPSQHSETMVEASLIVRPIDDLDLEEEALRREGLLSDSSQHSRSDLVRSDNEESDWPLKAKKLVEEELLSGSEEHEWKLQESKSGESELDEGNVDEIDYGSSDLAKEDGEEPEVQRKAQRKLSAFDYEGKVEEKSEVEDEDQAPLTLRDFGYDEEAETEEEEKDYGYKEESEVELDEKKVAARDDSQDFGSEAGGTTADEDHEPLTMRDYGYRAEAENKERVYPGEEKEHISLTSRGYSYEEETVEEEEPAVTMRDYGYQSEKIEKEKDIDDGEDEKRYSDEEVLEKDAYDEHIDLEEHKSNLEHHGYELEPPHPPPRRKSTTAIESTPAASVLTITEPKEIAPLPTVVENAQSGLPTRVGDLEVERLRVHALQAGQIMVSQLHGSQISADELQCKSGNLVVNNIEFPPGLIENIVERVRNSERGQLLTSETQTSREMLLDEPYETSRGFQLETQIPPPKPPRLRASETISSSHKPTDTALDQLRNYDEQTQTDPSDPPQLPPVYTSVEYLQSLAPLAFYNLRQAEMERYATDPAAPKEHHHHRHHHVHHRRRSCSLSDTDADEYKEHETRSTSRRSRTRSASHAQHSEGPQTVGQASRQFLSACSFSLANIINQFTAMLRGGDEVDERRQRHVQALVVLFVIFSFCVLLYLLSGKSVHTHHWDYFNPPNNQGRKSS